LKTTRTKRTLFDTFPRPSFSTPNLGFLGAERSDRVAKMLIGYARVSTDDQSLDLQLDALERAGCNEVFSDKGFSGVLRSRPALDGALGSLGAGDTLVTWRLDRLGRSLSHLISLVTDLEGRGVAFKSLSDGIDTSTPAGRLQFHMLGALAEFERCLISERTRAGIAAARSRGGMIGRPAKLIPSDVDTAISELRQRSLAEVAKRFEVSPVTLRRALRNRKKLVTEAARSTDSGCKRRCVPSLPRGRS
jgi:DNA invertase Pin-like site-specific DNA recombinase